MIEKEDDEKKKVLEMSIDELQNFLFVPYNCLREQESIL